MSLPLNRQRLQRGSDGVSRRAPSPERLRLNDTCLRDSHSAAQATRETGAIPRSATTWENNPLVEFSRTACGDERVRKALDLLEVQTARSCFSARMC